MTAMPSITPKRASATMTAFGEVEIRTPYSDRTMLLVDDLKQEIPARFRRWDAEDKVWRVLGAYAPTAIDLLLEHFPSAEVPDDQPRRRPIVVARTERPVDAPRPPLPPLIVETPAANDQTPLDPVLAIVPCPKCHQRYQQPIRVTAETSMTIAKRDRFTPEFVAVCPSCHTLAVVAFWPAAAPAAS